MGTPISLGVSTCLLGDPVRYDGRSKRDSWISEVLARHFQLVRVCPEVQAGLGIPRPPMRLVGDLLAPRVLTIATGEDRTPVLAAFVADELLRLFSGNLRGFIFKSRSPSCGMHSVGVFDLQGGGVGMTSGLFARAFCRAFPLAVVVEETDLVLLEQQRHFVERIFVADRWMKFVMDDGCVSGLSEFHKRHKFQIMAHDAEAMQSLERLASGTSDLVAAYGLLLYDALVKPATLACHVKCMMGLYGFLKGRLSSAHGREFLHLLDSYRLGNAPRSEPVSWLAFQAQRYDHRYLMEQWYLFPDQREIDVVQNGFALAGIRQDLATTP